MFLCTRVDRLNQVVLQRCQREQVVRLNFSNESKIVFRQIDTLDRRDMILHQIIIYYFSRDRLKNDR